LKRKKKEKNPGPRFSFFLQIASVPGRIGVYYHSIENKMKAILVEKKKKKKKDTTCHEHYPSASVPPLTSPLAGVSCILPLISIA
jgi:hypothetical protein